MRFDRTRCNTRTRDCSDGLERFGPRPGACGAAWPPQTCGPHGGGGRLRETFCPGIYRQASLTSTSSITVCRMKGHKSARMLNARVRLGYGVAPPRLPTDRPESLAAQVTVPMACGRKALGWTIRRLRIAPFLEDQHSRSSGVRDRSVPAINEGSGGQLNTNRWCDGLFSSQTPAPLPDFQVPSDPCRASNILGSRRLAKTWRPARHRASGCPHCAGRDMISASYAVRVL